MLLRLCSLLSSMKGPLALVVHVHCCIHSVRMVPVLRQVTFAGFLIVSALNYFLVRQPVAHLPAHASDVLR